ncbi:MAG: hypothetical protein QM535_18635 [Limnohabitans sp.]|nr:hypothetical protein [Limnohabitans sp.]
MTDTDINIAIGKLLANTKTKKRPFNIVEVANQINIVLKKQSLNELATTLGIKSAMLSKFLSVYKLPNFIKELVESRVIDSVAVVFYLSKLGEKDLYELLPFLKDDKINSVELKSFLPFRKQHPTQSIAELYNQHIASKNIKVSVIRLAETDLKSGIENLKNNLYNLLPQSEIITIEKNKKFVDIKLTKGGENLLRDKARNKNITLQNLIQEIVN